MSVPPAPFSAGSVADLPPNIDISGTGSTLLRNSSNPESTVVTGSTTPGAIEGVPSAGSGKKLGAASRIGNDKSGVGVVAALIASAVSFGLLPY